MPLKIKGLDMIRLTLTADEDAAPAMLTMSWARTVRGCLESLRAIKLSEG